MKEKNIFKDYSGEKNNMFKSIKKIGLIILMLIVSFVIFTHILFQLLKDPYLSGKDTVESFGDGRYQIIRVSDEKHQEILLLVDLKTNETIETQVYNKKEINNIVYLVSANGYCVLDYKNGILKKSKYLEDFNGNDINIFNQIRYTKMLNY